MSPAPRPQVTGPSQETRLTAFQAAGMIRRWRRGGRSGQYTVTTVRGTELELRSPREAYVFCNGIGALLEAPEPLVLSGVSASFDADELELLVRIAVDERPPGPQERELLARATKLVDFEHAVGEQRGRLWGCYDATRVNDVLAPVGAAAGLELGCLWELHDAAGFHGTPSILTIERGRLRELSPLATRWLTGDPGDSLTPLLPGEVSTWVGQSTGVAIRALAHHDGLHNYAERKE
jgi:hypothetical protein